MFREIYRILKSNVLTITGMCFFIVLIIIGCYYAINCEIKPTYNINEYASNSELEIRIEELQQQNEEIESLRYMESEIEYNNRLIRLYKYIINKNITYDDLINNYTSYDSNPQFPNDIYDFMIAIFLPVFIFTILIIIIISTMVVNYDFSNGIWKQKYASQTPRSSILKNKFFATLLISEAVYILSVILMLILGSVYKLNYKFIVFADLTNILVMGAIDYLVLVFFSGFISMVFFSITIFGICTLIKNMYIALLVNSIFVVAYFIIGTSSRGILSILMSEPSLFYTTDNPLWLAWLLWLIRYGLAIGLIFLARHKFTKRELS
ncbi:MAG: ABC transporter permease subunit [Christensenellaceae bacterium]|jgi:hypothetical protein|nr:ABC transporter permease subunit [Christensenellaceae bacterium]